MRSLQKDQKGTRKNTCPKTYNLIYCQFKSTKSPICRTYLFTPKKEQTKTCIQIFWIELLVPSKYLKFLSFRTLHQMQVQMIFHQSSSPSLYPTLHELLKNPRVELRTTNFIPKIQKNMSRKFIVVLQCKKWVHCSQRLGHVKDFQCSSTKKG